MTDHPDNRNPNLPEEDDRPIDQPAAGGPDLTVESNAAPPIEVPEEARMADRLERLGGEPAPAISPEEFARLQQSGQIHIDSRGRVQTSRREETDAGMSLRKRRAWYA